MNKRKQIKKWVTEDGVVRVAMKRYTQGQELVERTIDLTYNELLKTLKEKMFKDTNFTDCYCIHKNDLNKFFKVGE